MNSPGQEHGGDEVFQMIFRRFHNNPRLHRLNLARTASFYFLLAIPLSLR